MVKRIQVSGLGVLIPLLVVGGMLMLYVGFVRLPGSVPAADGPAAVGGKGNIASNDASIVAQPAPNDLAGRVWRWSGTTLNDGTKYIPDDREKYTISFLSDGKASIKADCNSVQANYVTGAGQTLTITLGPSTRVACPPGSLDAQFLQGLSNVGSYIMQGADLILALKFDSGSMKFVAPEVEPVQPVQPIAPIPAPPTTNSDLVGKVWEWRKTITSNDANIIVKDPSRYTIEFLADGTIEVKADCRNIGGTYTVSGTDLSIQLGPAIQIACPPDSQDADYLMGLDAVSGYLVEGNTLSLSTKQGSDFMIFAPHGEITPGMPSTGHP
jgi:heat shock protein HslJ